MSSGFVHKRAGFSLLEFAIVLAVIGIVLGALWGVVGMVRENIKREELTGQMTVIVSKIRDHYAGRACASLNFGCPLGSTPLTDYLFRQNVLLPEQLRDRLAGVLVADHPWGATADDDSLLANGGIIVSSVGDGRNAFQIQLLGLQESSCIAVAGSLSGASAPAGLISMTINGTGMALPVTPDAAAGVGGCVTAPVSPQNAIVLTYSLRL